MNGWDLKTLPLKLVRPVPSDMEIASAQVPKPVSQLAAEIGVLPSELIAYGTHKAKVGWSTRLLRGCCLIAS